MNIQAPFFILSAHPDDSVIPGYRSHLLERQLRAAGFATAQCRGCYKGKREDSVIVIDEDPSCSKCYDTVVRLARLHQQESVLAVDANRRAALIFTDGSPLESIGFFTNADEAYAVQQDAWTERAGRYYVCS